MDKEMLVTEKAPRTRSKHELLIAAAVILCIALSSVAMVMSVLTYCNLQRDAGTADTVVVVGDSSWEERVLSELESVFEENHIMSFNHEEAPIEDGTETARVQRDSDRISMYDETCNSTGKSGNNSKPLAHIIAKNFRGRDAKVIPSEDEWHTQDYVVITKNWICEKAEEKGPFGFISGGMVFNRSTGFLILPTDGVYFVYSHAQFRLKSKVTHETSARMVACLPGERCEIVNANSNPTLLESSDSVSQQLNRNLHHPAYGDNGLYQGGLFHFPAHTQISLLVKDPKFGNNPFEQDKLFASFVGKNAYMGAFLVQETPFRSTT